MNALEKRLGIALLVSLVANAFLLGSIATHFARRHHLQAQHHHALRARGGPPDFGPPGHLRERWGKRGPAEAKLLRDVVDALGGPRDPRVEGVLAHGRGQRMAHQRRMTEAQDAVVAALAAEPYDETRLRSRLAELRSAAEVGQQEAQEGLVLLAGQLSPEERRTLRSGPPEQPKP
jgi:uncharacterized membrane protein